MDNKRKICFISGQRHSGGAERVASILANELSSLNYDVHFVQYESSSKDYYLAPTVNVHILNIKSQNAILRKCERLINTVKIIRTIDAYYIFPFVGGSWESLAASIGKVDMHVISCIRINPQLSPASKSKRVLRNLFCILADGVFTQNVQQSAYFSFVKRKKVFFVPNPIDNNLQLYDYSNLTNVKRIVTAGRLEKQKNHALLIKAFSKVLSECPNITLSIYGEGGEKDNLQKLINEYNINNYVKLEGRCNNVHKSYQTGDIFILSSNFEGMPNALMEAMAVGLPVISTNCPTGPSDIITNEKNGLLISCNDEMQMAESIRFYISNPEIAKTYAKNAKKTIIERYSANIIADELMNKCNKTIGG